MVVVFLIATSAFKLVSNKRSAHEQLKLATEFVTTAPVTIDTVKLLLLKKEFTESGSFIPFREIVIQSETQGKVRHTEVGIGDRVKAGQILACTDNEILKSQFEMASYNLEKAENDLLRFELLASCEAATLQQYEMARQNQLNASAALVSSRIQLENSYIKAPFDGIIVKKYVENGTYLLPGTPVFDIIDISKVKLILKLTADEVEQAKPGQKVLVLVDEFQGETFPGTVIAVEDRADQAKRFCVEIVVSNHAKRSIRPGMFGSAVFSSAFTQQSLVIPRRSLAGSIRNPEVYLVEGDSVVLKSIQAVPFNDKQIIVSSGLQAGDIIVTSGQINLVNGSRITITH
jgi:RND family efflux transporter MFP subunit